MTTHHVQVGPADEQTLALDSLHDAEALLLEALHKLTTAHPCLPVHLRNSIVTAGVWGKANEAHRELDAILSLRPSAPEGVEGS